MYLNVNEWKEFKVGNVFICETTPALDINTATEGTIPYITRSAENNGLADYFGNKELLVKGNCITIGAEGRVAFYQANDFIAGVKIYTLRNEELNVQNAMFLCSILNKSCYLYSYGRARILDKIKEEVVKLPICKNEDGEPIIDSSHKYSEEGYIPDFKWMENYIKTLKYKPLTTANAKMDTTYTHLDVTKWKVFKLGKLFTFENGKKYPKSARESGGLPLVSTSAENNGVSDYIATRADHVHSNFLTVAYSGSVGATFYHEQDVFVGETVLALLPTFDMTRYIGMFISTVMNFENYRYSYGRKIKSTEYGDTTIKLPVCYEEDGITPKIDDTHKYSEEGYIPDFKWMEDYIKTLPYGDRL